MLFNKVGNKLYKLHFEKHNFFIKATKNYPAPNVTEAVMEEEVLAIPPNFFLHIKKFKKKKIMDHPKNFFLGLKNIKVFFYLSTVTN
jgi:hypothetical protein